MKRKFAVLFITLFSLAALSLIVIQITQTRHATEVSGTLFNISVSNAMDSAIAQLEQEIKPKSTNLKNELQESDFILFDSIISDELLINGVDIKPDIAILSNTEEILYCSTPSRQQTLLVSPYKYTYYPHGDNSLTPYFVALGFSSRGLYLQQNIAFYNLLSEILIAVIVVLFILSFRIIHNQRKVDEMKTDFISNMTHEIKTPIATISLACEMLQDDSISTDVTQRRNFVGIISDENRRMRVLIETILQSAKMSNKNFSLSPTSINLNDNVREVCKTFNLTINNRQGEIVIQTNTESTTIYADTLHISNMIHNLVDNAIKYTTDRPPHIVISTDIVENDMVQLKVSDNGIGIAKEDQRHIFEKFYRVNHGNVHNVKGFGIGLNYVAQVVKLHHGTISVQSELGQGTTFTVLLPHC